MPNPIVRKAIACALAAVTPILFSSSALAETDVLERPVLASPKSLSSLVLSVARAGEHLVAVGERGLVLVSDDNGRSWRQSASVPVSVTLTAVQFVSSKVGWAVGHGGVILKSTDGGESWSLQLDGRRAAEIYREAVISSSLPGNAGDRSDRKLAEAERMVADGPDKPFLGLLFRDDLHGVVVGAYGLIFATDDGGRTWRSWHERLNNPGGRHLYWIGMEGSHAFICGEQGALFRSDDGGASFSEVKTPYRGTYFGAVPLGAGGLLVFGLRGNAWISANGVDGWQRVETSGADTLNDAARLANGMIVMADQAGTLLISRDNGKTFSPHSVRKAPLTAVAPTADGAVALAGPGGVTRISLQDIGMGVAR